MSEINFHAFKQSVRVKAEQKQQKSRAKAKAASEEETFRRRRITKSETIRQPTDNPQQPTTPTSIHIWFKKYKQKFQQLNGPEFGLLPLHLAASIDMRLLMVIAILIFAMPMTGFGWAEGTNILLDPNLMCKKTRRLRGKLAEICRHDSALLKEIIINGINLGFRECEFQFRNRRWNCTVLRKSMRKILMRDSRETGFVNAVTAAGVTYAVTKACTMGTLVECSCDKAHMRRNGGQFQMVTAETAGAALDRQQQASMLRQQLPQSPNRESNNSSNASITELGPLAGRRNNGRNGRRPGGRKGRRKFWDNIKFPEGEWEWGGCSDNVNFGLRHSRVFLDAKQRQRRSDLGTLVKLHNNNAGRLKKEGEEK
nr:protein Wnt-2b isoform X2 [Drosophila bipectinata]